MWVWIVIGIVAIVGVGALVLILARDHIEERKYAAERVRLYDDTVPFVNALHGVMVGKTSAEVAAAILREAEKRHGIEFLHSLEREDHLCGVYLPRSLERRLPFAQILELIGDEEKLLAYYVHPESPNECPAGIIEALMGLLTETRCLVRGMSFDAELFLRFRDGSLISNMTSGAWGGLLADWANKAELLQAKVEYVDFKGVNERYVTREWDAAVLKVIRLKSEMLLVSELNAS